MAGGDTVEDYIELSPGDVVRTIDRNVPSMGRSHFTWRRYLGNGEYQWWYTESSDQLEETAYARGRDNISDCKFLTSVWELVSKPGPEGSDGWW